MNNKSSTKLALAVVFGAVWLSSCAVGPNYVKPDVPVEQKFEGTATPAGTTPTAFSDDSTILAQFWTQFGDDTLNTLVSEALTANHDLRIALARFTEARAARGESKFDLAPTITASGGYTEQRPDPITRSEIPGGEIKLYNAGFDAIWELDFFGRIRRNIEATTADAQSAEANLHDAQIVVIAEVARTYFELRGQQSQLDVARRNVQNQRDTLNLTTARLDAGRGTELDTSRAQAQLSATLGTIGPLEAAVARSIHRLSVLTGREPTALTSTLTKTAELPPLPQVIAVGNPADLLRRRPDIRASERQLAASTARIGVAVADLFPKVTFTGSLGYAAVSSGDLGDRGTGTRLIAPGISWAAFDIGRVRAQIAGARARTDESLALYEQTVLRALEETEDALVTHARSRDSLEHLGDSARASATAARLARARFDGGIVDFIEVLDSERTQLEAEDRLAQSRTDTATSLIAVYKALGGGWQEAPIPRRIPLAAVTSGSR
ncbi:MAG TPA: efflux transporter outer membrane subunit [Steroidobacteraceae bacterium]|nr:efflux transporter outer membrane subunit [Steroidobacteraceae bacterium]